MRKLLYFTIGFAVACGLCVWLIPIEHTPGILHAALILSGIAFLMSRERKLLCRLALVLLGSGAAFCWYLRYDSIYLSPVAGLDEITQIAAIRVSDYSYETTYGIAFDGRLRLGDQSYQVKTYLSDVEQAVPGQTVTGEFCFRVTLPDAAEESSYHQGKGIFLMAYQRGEVTISQDIPHWMDSISRFRRETKDMLFRLFPEDTAPFALALLLGDGSQLDYATDSSFKISGISHVIAVSGQHVMLVFTLVSMVTFRKRLLTALLGFPVLFLFAALTGFTPSVMRACLMTGLMLLGMVLEKEYDGFTGLSFACLVMLVMNPMVIASVSFQLSVGSVAGIFLFQGPIKVWLQAMLPSKKKKTVLRSFLHNLISSSAITISAMTITVPLSTFHFGTVSLVSILTNLLTLWVISFVFYGILFLCLLSFLSISLAGFLAGILSWPIRYVLWTAKYLADIPFAAVYTRSPYILAWVVFLYLLLGIFLLMKKKRPGILVCFGTMGLCMALLASWAEPRMSDLRFTVLDVGQGQCLLFQWKDQTYMVDCGGDSDTVTADIAAETLLSQGITTLDGLILTHLDRDHAGAAANLLSRIDTKLLIIPETCPQLSESADCETVYAVKDLQLRSEEMDIHIFAPLFPGKSNEMSLCILFDTKKCDILITGDRNGFGERSLLRHSDIPDVDILVAGHHGSKYSTCEELLQAARPEIVCISAGKDNSYGHPAPELLQRLQEHHCTVYRTDLHGDILIRR